MTEDYGTSVERRRREIAAHHGVPDFVFRPAVIRAGSGQVEVGDFLLWVGDVVAIVSCKSRDPDAAAKETQDRRRRWLDRNIAEAYGQIKGTFGTLTRAEAGSIVLESERGIRVPWDPNKVVGYVGVVVVDAPAPEDDYGPPVMPDRVPTIAMLGEDWDALNCVLPSTMALIRYLGRRMIAIPRCPLGAELDVLALVLECEYSGQSIALPPGGLRKDHFETVAAAHPDWFLIFTRLVRRAGLPAIRFHDLRHSHVVHLIERGVDPLTISRRLGHASVAFTLDRYGHLFDRAGETAAQAIGDLLGMPSKAPHDHYPRGEDNL